MTRVRTAALLLIALLSTPACKSRDPEPLPTPAKTPEKEPSPPSLGSAAIAPPLPAVTRWELDPENSSAAFVCKHVFSNVRGMLHQPKGTVTFDDANPAGSKVEATLEVRTLTTGVEERDAHLKGPDFFDMAKHPHITFVSTGVTRSSGTAYAVTGNLTMHGVTKPVTLAVSASPPFHHAGGVRRGIEATTTVNRKDFGLRWEFPGEGPGVVVGDEIQISVDAELVLQ